MRFMHDPLVGHLRIFHAHHKNGDEYCDRYLRRKGQEFLKRAHIHDRLKREHTEFDQYGVITYCITGQQKEIEDFERSIETYKH